MESPKKQDLLKVCQVATLKLAKLHEKFEKTGFDKDMPSGREARFN